MTSFCLRDDAIPKNLKNPLASMSIRFNTRRVEDFGGEIPPEKPPCRTIESRTDVMLIAADDFTDGKSWWTVCEEGTTLNQGLVSEGMISDEDSRTRTHIECDDWAELGVDGTEDRLQIERGPPEKQEVADDGQGKGARWKVAGGEEEFEDRVYEVRSAERDDDEEPDFHV